MDSATIRKKFREFFEKNGHTWVASSSLIPDDPSVLLTTAGMQQFKRYYTGELDPMKDFGGRNTASIQKSFRTSDIDEVGDETHLTFFEMLGNFSFGGYWKKEALALAHEFITKEMKLPISHVTVFRGSSAVPKDEESKKIWKSLGVTDIREEGMEDVFWGPTGTSGPCGPTTEIYCKSVEGKEVEVWNIVFNEFFCEGLREELLKGKVKLTPLNIKGIDTGMGLERLAMIAQGKKMIFQTDLFKDAFKRDFGGRSGRIFLDHVRGAIFLIADGAQPSNRGIGYVLRRLMRRAIFHVRKLIGGDEHGSSKLGASEIQMTIKNSISFYGNVYPELEIGKEMISAIFEKEYERFVKTLNDGIREFYRLTNSEPRKLLGKISGKDAFRIYQSFGLPREVMKDVGAERGIKFDDEAFDTEFKKHQEISRVGQEKKFGGHGLILNTGELKAGNEEELQKVLRLHTATHLLQQALREVLGTEVQQTGSDITPERTRFDFSFPRKMTPEEVRRAEALVNQKIKEDLPVSFKEMSKAEAEKVGALHFFKEKYPERVKVYYVGRDLASAWSKEFCGGPHVARSGEVGHFRIAKEEAVGAGVRRVRGTID